MLECNTITSDEFVSCGECEDGFFYSDKEGARKCKCLLEWQRRKKLKHLLNKSNIPYVISSDPKAVTLLDYKIDKDYVGDDKQGNIPKTKKFIKNFDSKYSSLNMYFLGKHSCQKSTLARVIGRDLLKQGKSVRYIMTDTLVKMLVDAERDEEIKSEVKKILAVDCLILDEFSVDKVSIWKSNFQIPFLTSFLKNRLEVLRKSTIFCSNSPMDSLSEGFGEAIQRLIFREVLDKSMKFEDNYESKLASFDVSTLWD